MSNAALTARRQAPVWPALIACLSAGLCLGLTTAVRDCHAAAEDGWHVYVGDAVVDTVNGSLAQVKSAGQWVLLTDHWALDREDDKSARLVTRWRPVKHPLMRMVAGNACVRVAVALAEVTPGRTEVRVLGGIAAQTDLSGGPVLSLAQVAGQRECKGYVTELKARLADELTADGAASGSPRTASADKR